MFMYMSGKTSQSFFKCKVIYYALKKVLTRTILYYAKEVQWVALDKKICEVYTGVVNIPMIKASN